MMIRRLKKLRQAAKWDAQQRAELQAWEKRLREANLLISLGNHDGVKFIRSEIEKKQGSYDRELLSERTDQARREHIFRMKEMYSWFDGLFQNAQNEEKSIEHNVAETENNLKNLNLQTNATR